MKEAIPSALGFQARALEISQFNVCSFWVKYSGATWDEMHFIT